MTARWQNLLRSKVTLLTNRYARWHSPFVFLLFATLSRGGCKYRSLSVLRKTHRRFSNLTNLGSRSELSRTTLLRRRRDKYRLTHRGSNRKLRNPRRSNGYLSKTRRSITRRSSRTRLRTSRDKRSTKDRQNDKGKRGTLPTLHQHSSAK